MNLRVEGTMELLEDWSGPIGGVTLFGKEVQALCTGHTRNDDYIDAWTGKSDGSVVSIRPEKVFLDLRHRECEARVVEVLGRRRGHPRAAMWHRPRAFWSDYHGSAWSYEYPQASVDYPGSEMNVHAVFSARRSKAWGDVGVVVPELNTLDITDDTRILFDPDRRVVDMQALAACWRFVQACP